ncbi:hypothetical protein CLOM_g8996 [Closterium sp. NIES-68]|nr:hypothetical protein CLOM_g8996 [Closterium sp. NIES-68]GJP83958.1 hypothetical protein CLOP_g14057 [Closterium sp. NIES-67]
MKCFSSLAASVSGALPLLVLPVVLFPSCYHIPGEHGSMVRPGAHRGVNWQGGELSQPRMRAGAGCVCGCGVGEVGRSGDGVWESKRGRVVC